MPSITITNFKYAIMKVKPSVSKETIVKLEEWDARLGSGNANLQEDDYDHDFDDF